MIEKMQFLSITGPKDDIDRFADVYLSKYEMHLEYALSELSNVKGLLPFVDSSPYRNINSKLEDIMKFISKKNYTPSSSMTIEEAVTVIDNAHEQFTKYQEERLKLLDKKKEIDQKLHEIEPFKVLPFDVDTIRKFEFIKFRYGRISHDHFNKFVKYEYPNLEVIFYETDSDDDYVWGIYFVPAEYEDKINAIFASLQFESISLPDELGDNSDESYNNLSKELQETTAALKALRKQFKTDLSKERFDILDARFILSTADKNKDIRKYAALTRDISVTPDANHKTFYILCGWMSKKDVVSFFKDIEEDPDVFCMSEDNHDLICKPPTKLKNPSLFKPFEMYVKMYGLPAYNEIDPTCFVALTYSFLFGMMFGDVGQGLLLFILGFLLYKTKKMDLAAIISLAGIFSTVFGFLYGSIFGFEDVFIHAIWISPMHRVMLILVSAIGFGVLLNLTTMIMNIINGIKSGNKGRIIVDTNGIAGFIFYVVIIACAAIKIPIINNQFPALKKLSLPADWILTLCIVIPLISIFLREPLSNLLAKKEEIIEGSKGMFFVQAFFEMFEVLLSFMTNTLSFVRVGAFALSHAGMMSVVLMLANAEGSLSSLTVGNIVTLVIGNLFVMGLEGLSVGIQVLRLEYYEMFSRFYGGTGKEFKPFKLQVQK